MFANIDVLKDCVLVQVFTDMGRLVSMTTIVLPDEVGSDVRLFSSDLSYLDHTGAPGCSEEVNVDEAMESEAEGEGFPGFFRLKPKNN